MKNLSQKIKEITAEILGETEVIPGKFGNISKSNFFADKTLYLPLEYSLNGRLR